MLETNVDNANATQKSPNQGPHGDHSGLDQSLDQVQELTRNIESMLRSAGAGGGTLSSNATQTGSMQRTEGGVGGGGAGAQSQSLPELDRLLADDLDDLLKSDVQTIDAVLNNVFEEQAVIVQRLDQPTAAPPPQTPIASVAQSSLQPVASVPPQTDPHSRWTEHVAYTPQTESENRQPAALDVQQHQVEPLDNSATIAPLHHSDRSRTSLNFKAILSVIAWPLIALLQLMNLPLRLVPQPWRPVVDWVALSLLLWAPLVWMLVVFAT